MGTLKIEILTGTTREQVMLNPKGRDMTNKSPKDGYLKTRSFNTKGHKRGDREVTPPLF